MNFIKSLSSSCGYYSNKMYISGDVVIHYPKFKDREIDGIIRKKIPSVALVANSPAFTEFSTDKVSLKVINYTALDIGLSAKNYLRIQDDLFNLITKRKIKIVVFEIDYYSDVVCVVQKNKENLYFIFIEGAWNRLYHGEECVKNADMKRKALTIWKGTKDQKFFLNKLPKEITNLILQKFVLAHDPKQIQLGLKKTHTGECIRSWSVI